MRRQLGFTLVELVIVMIIIGVLSFVAAPLFFSSQQLASKLVSEQLISQLQLAQRVALGMSNQANPVSMQINASDATWQLALLKTNPAGGDPLRFVVDLERGNTAMSVDGNAINSGDTVTFAWDANANLTPYQNYTIRVQGESSQTVCLSAAGFAYRVATSCP